MIVELAKRVEDEVRQRARFKIVTLPGDRAEVRIVIHPDDQPTDEVETVTVDSTGNAYAHIYRVFVAHFTDFSLDELEGAEVAWNMAAYDDTPQNELDLAEMIAAVIMEELEAETENFKRDMHGETDGLD